METLAYEITGPDNAPVLVLGSSLGSDRHMWNEILPSLSKFRVLRYEHPGHGDSVCLSGPGPHTPADLAAAIWCTLDRAGIDRFHLAGLSLGGMMALWMAVHSDDRIESVTMMSSGPAIMPSSDWTDKAALVRYQGTAPLVDATMQRWFTDAYRRRQPAALERTRNTLRECSDEGYAQCCEVISNLDCRSDLDKLRVPLAIIHADQDQTLPPNAAGELAAKIRQRSGVRVELYPVDHAAHMSAVEQPEVVGSYLRQFLNSF